MLIINKGTAFKAIFVLHIRYIKRLIYIMYSNMASRQWFIGVKRGIINCGSIFFRSHLACYIQRGEDKTSVSASCPCGQ